MDFSLGLRSGVEMLMLQNQVQYELTGVVFTPLLSRLQRAFQTCVLITKHSGLDVSKMGRYVLDNLVGLRNLRETSSYDMPSAWFVSKATSKCL